MLRLLRSEKKVTFYVTTSDKYQIHCKCNDKQNCRDGQESEQRFNTCKGSKSALKRPNLCTGVEFNLQFKSLSRDHREKTEDITVDFTEIHWKVGRRHGLSILSTIFTFLKFHGEKTNGILWKLLRKLGEDTAESSHV
ncbi:hypothetical protein llap_13758 [Limosa lapponica baueri]|uniref:Uncharacterized protein n=1 Tax=Limosa lapponica baueri TaxID=1758121 RepID=A0A2I0TQ48_LIMLA|nr:hypothetical protein llap_13758 [Limosa lapponica baueri]